MSNWGITGANSAEWKGRCQVCKIADFGKVGCYL